MSERECEFYINVRGLKGNKCPRGLDDAQPGGKCRHYDVETCSRAFAEQTNCPQQQQRWNDTLYRFGVDRDDF